MDILTSSFVDTISPSTDFRYNLVWMYGGFLEDVPARIGRNSALDAAVEAVVVAHADFCSFRPIQISFLLKYSRALESLRKMLDDPLKARSSETLCSAMMLLICQGLVGACEGLWTGHCEGAAQILKARGPRDAQDDFENKLLLSLRGPVLFEGIFNNRIKFQLSEWNELVLNHLDGQMPEDRLMRRLAQIPEYMHRARTRWPQSAIPDLQLLNEMRSSYEILSAEAQDARQRYALVQKRIDQKASPASLIVQAHAYLQRLYGLCLTVCLLFSSVLAAVEPSYEVILRLETANFAREIVLLCQDATRYRPLASSYVALFLYAAWLGTAEHSIKTSVESQLAEHRLTWSNGTDQVFPVPYLQFLSQRIRHQVLQRGQRLQEA